MRALTKPFQNLDDPDEQIVASLVAHLGPVLAPWRKGEDLREERSSLEAKLSKTRRDVTTLQRKGEGLATALTGVIKTPLVLGLVVVGLILLGVGYLVGAAFL